MIVDFKKLSQAIDRVRPTVAKDDQVEVCTLLCFRDGKIKSFDGVSGTVTPSGTQLDCSVNAKKFVALVNALKNSTCDVRVHDGWMTVQAGNHFSKLPVQESASFPDIMPKQSTAYCEAPDFLDALRLCAASAEKDNDKPQVYGVGFRGHYVYSTDGKRITRAAMSKPVMFPASIPKPAVDQLLRLGQPSILFSAGQNLGALYRDTKTVFLTRTVEAQFPYDVLDAVFERDYWRKTMVETPGDLLEIVDRLAALTDNEESTLQLRCVLGELHISTTSETGSAKDSLPFPTEEWEARVKAETLRNALKRYKPTHLDLSDVLHGEKRMLVFRGDGWEHAASLMI